MKRRLIAIISVVLVVACMSVLLIACAPKSLDKAELKLKELEYKVETKDLGVDGCEVLFSKDDHFAKAKMFADKNALNKYYDEQKKAVEQSKKDFENTKKEFETQIKNATGDAKKDLQKQLNILIDNNKNSVVKKSGWWVVVGHRVAVNDFIF